MVHIALSSGATGLTQLSHGAIASHFRSYAHMFCLYFSESSSLMALVCKEMRSPSLSAREGLALGWSYQLPAWRYSQARGHQGLPAMLAAHPAAPRYQNCSHYKRITGDYSHVSPEWKHHWTGVEGRRGELPGWGEEGPGRKGGGTWSSSGRGDMFKGHMEGQGGKAQGLKAGTR